MISEAILLAALLHAPAGLVDAVYQAGGLDAVAVVSCESQFNPRAVRREPRGHTSWGLFQLDDEFHPQHRGDLLLHIVEGASFLAWCKGRHTSLRFAMLDYNGSIAWGWTVENRRDQLARWLWKHEGIAGA